MSPKNKKIEIRDENKILKLNKTNTYVDNKNDIDVPDQVFFGLILGMISGPPIYLPAI